MKYHIVHTTRYDYSQTVSLCHSEARLSPREVGMQQCLASQLKITPDPTDFQERKDFFGNRVTYFAIQQPHSQLTVTSISDVEVTMIEKAGQKPTEESWESVCARLKNSTPAGTISATELQETLLYRLDSDMAAASKELKEYAAISFKPGMPLIDVAEDLTQRIYQDFSYDPSFTTIATPLATVLAHKRGVCQDFAHLAIACFRAFALPARYVSGYIETTPPPGVVKLTGSDASHAWFSVYLPGNGWLDFDPTNNCRAGNQHITLAWGRDYKDVTPVKGLAIGGGKHHVSVSVDVSRPA